MFKNLKKVYIMIKHVIDKLPIHGYITTKSIQITDGKSIIERAILIETHNRSLSNTSRCVQSNICKKGAKGCFVKECKR